MKRIAAIGVAVGVAVSLVVTAAWVTPIGDGTSQGPGSTEAAPGDGYGGDGPSSTDEGQPPEPDAVQVVPVGLDPARGQDRSGGSDDSGFSGGGGPSGKYCKALRSALSSSQRALDLQGRKLRQVQRETAQHYRQAAKQARSRSVERAMNAVSTVYLAVLAGDKAGAADASAKRFAAVPAAAPSVLRDCGVDLYRPVDYRFTVDVSA